jgi:2-hydroxy-6-oxonona-2,4-dienedioate hydrolase
MAAEEIMRITRWRSVVVVVGVALLAGLALVAGTFVGDLRRAHERVRSAGTILASPYGDIEFTVGGSGPTVLVIHGGGGGYDQGQVLVDAVLGDGFHWITPSRFGYLGSDLPPGATWDDQADAFAHLLDHLGLDRVAVVALSQGGPSALLLAVRHPERVASLTCLSCGVAPSADGEQADANRKGDMLKAVFARDYRYWVMSRYFRRQFMGLMGATPAVVAELTPEQRETIDHIIDYMNPASPRAAGAAFDNEAELPGERIAGITAPTLIVHAEDDMLQLYRNAEFAASRIPGATLLSFRSGGHLVVAVEREAIGAAVRAHILTPGLAPLTPPAAPPANRTTGTRRSER